MKTYFHGEVVIVKIKELPAGLKQIKAKDGHYIVANSETTGNHHCLEDIQGVDLYEKNGVFFLKNEVPVKIFCVDEKRHDTEILESGFWEIDRANEYDFLKEMKKKVVD